MVALDDEALGDEGEVVELGFDFFGEDVLAAGGEYHGLTAAAKVDVAFFVDGAEVAGAEPAVFGEGFAGGFFVFVVAFHYMVASELYFACGCVGVVGVNADLHIGEYLAYRTGLEVFPPGVAYKGGAFCHAVAYGIGEFDFAEEEGYIGVHRGSSYDDLAESAAEGFDELVAYLLVDFVVEQGDVEGETHGAFVDEGLDDVFVDFLEYEGDGDDNVWLDLVEGFKEYLGCGGAAKEGDVGADGYSGEEVEGAAVGMGHGEEGEVSFAAAKEAGADSEHDVSGEVAACEHYAFAKACGAGCIVDFHYLVVVELCIDNVFGLVSAGVFFVHFGFQAAGERLDVLAVALVEAAEVVEGKYGAKAGHGVLFEVVPDLVADEEEGGFAMVDYMMDIIWAEVL